MYDGDGDKAEKNFTFNVMLPDNKQKSYYVKVWNDVVICRNGDGQFLTFQWYKAGEKCENASLQYFNDVNLLDGEYMVYVTDKAGKSYFIEPVTYAPVEASYAITAEPNVVARNADFTVKVTGVAEDDLKNARIVVYRANGLVERVIDGVEREHVMSLNSGEYVIVLSVNSHHRHFPQHVHHSLCLRLLIALHVVGNAVNLLFDKLLLGFDNDAFQFLIPCDGVVLYTRRICFCLGRSYSYSRCQKQRKQC